MFILINKINNLLEVTNQDTVGSAFLKSATKGYLQGVVASGIGLGVLVIGYKAISNKKESVEEEESINDEIRKNWDDIKELSNKDKELVDSL